MVREIDNVRHIAGLYHKVLLWIIATVTIIAFLAEQIVQTNAFTLSIVFSAVYFLVVMMLNGKCWCKAARQSSNTLTRFYFASSAVRMLLAFVVVLVGAFMLRADKTQTLGFALIFAAYYVLLLIFDCIFFSRIEKKHLIK